MQISFIYGLYIYVFIDTYQRICKFLSDLDELAGVLYPIEKMFGQVIWVNEITHERANIIFKAFHKLLYI